MGQDEKSITPKSSDFAQWYVEVVRRAELADYAPVKGCMVIRPYGYSIWERMQRILDGRIKDTGHANAYFPLFVPESFLAREAAHVEGFAPEVAWVTEAGGGPLEERMAIRPTSEAIIGMMYAKWIQSYRDLPVLINQWANVVRWEKRTRLFLRTTEFLWQEGHTCHAEHDEAAEEVLRMLEVYREFMEGTLAIPVVPGRKSASERFAGAEETYTLEALMPDGRAIQMGTSHDLGQHFAKAFDIKFLDRDQSEKYVWQTSWGCTTRMVGALVMVHGDDKGLRLPPAIAPYQVVIVPIYREKSRESVLAEAAVLRDSLGSDLRVHLDDRDGVSPGFKFNDWEMRGVPLRVELGPKDIEKNSAMVVRRDTGQKTPTPREGLSGSLASLLEEIQKGLYSQALAFREENTREASDLQALSSIIGEQGGFVRAPWCGSSECEECVKAETSATIRCMPLAGGDLADGPCVVCGAAGRATVLFAKAY